MAFACVYFLLDIRRKAVDAFFIPKLPWAHEITTSLQKKNYIHTHTHTGDLYRDLQTASPSAVLEKEHDDKSIWQTFKPWEKKNTALSSFLRLKGSDTISLIFVFVFHGDEEKRWPQAMIDDIPWIQFIFLCSDVSALFRRDGLDLFPFAFSIQRS